MICDTYNNILECSDGVYSVKVHPERMSIRIGLPVSCIFATIFSHAFTHEKNLSWLIEVLWRNFHILHGNISSCRETSCYSKNILRMEEATSWQNPMQNSHKNYCLSMCYMFNLPKSYNMHK